MQITLIVNIFNNCFVYSTCVDIIPAYVQLINMQMLPIHRMNIYSSQGIWLIKRYTCIIIVRVQPDLFWSWKSRAWISLPLTRMTVSIISRLTTGFRSIKASSKTLVLILPMIQARFWFPLYQGFKQDFGSRFTKDSSKILVPL